jgi:hypothetical protein
MTRRAVMRQADVRRLVKGAVEGARAAGWPDGSYSVEIVDGRVKVLPIAANAPSDDAADMAERIRRAFGDDDSASALHR